MASVTRQPFAPLDEARLQSLTSAKNRQNVTPLTVNGKRKAELLDLDFENVDPLLLAKRFKGGHGMHTTKDFPKKSSAVPLLKTASAPRQHAHTMSHPAKPTRASSHAQPRTPVAKQTSGLTKSSPLSAPAGRSPSRLNRPGIQSSRRRSAGPYTRVDPPSFRLDSSAAPFSLDAAVRGTVAGYGSRPKSAMKDACSDSKSLPNLSEPDMKATWFFDIHEDTPEQEMTNLLQYGTCALHILSEDESEQRAMRERAEGRDKENIPPADDVSQASEHSVSLPTAAMTVEKKRVALGEMNATDFYPVGCDESSIVIVPGDEEASFPTTLHIQPHLSVTEHEREALNDADSFTHSLCRGSSRTHVVQLRGLKREL